MKKIFDLSKNESPFKPSSKVLFAINKAAKSLNRYPSHLREALKIKLADYVSLKKENIILANGSSELLYLLFSLNLEREILIAQYSFVRQFILTKQKKSKIKIIQDESFSEPLEGFLENINKDTGMIVVTNPSNPLGRTISFKELSSFIKSVPPHILVLIDEAYHEYADPFLYQTASSLIQDHPNLIIIRTFSKAFALAGLRLGYGLSNSNLVKLIEEQQINYDLSELSLAAGIAVLSEPSRLKKVLSFYSKEKEKLKTFFLKKNISIVGDQGNFFTLNLGEKAQPIFEKMKEEGIIINHLGIYGLPNLLRISIGTKSQNKDLMKLFDSLNFFDKLNS